MNKELILSDLKKYVAETNADIIKKQLVFRFPNNYGASVIIGPYTYGGDEGLYELAVIKWNDDVWHLCYDTPITDDVIGYLTPEGVGKLLGNIMALPDKQLIGIEHEID